jgi:transcription-repair coupling factor (superfamily II helicase)
MPPEDLPAEPEPLLAARLTEAAAEAPLILVARSEARAARLHRAARTLAPRDLAIGWLPAWDCLPYDRVSPSAEVMGARMALAAGPAPRLLILSVEAATQRLPRPDARDALRLQVGGQAEAAALLRRLAALGHRLDEVVDEPGEAAARGGVVDIFPAVGDRAWRLRLEEGRIAAIEPYDPATQRSLDEAVPELTVGPASELLLPEAEAEAGLPRPPGLVHFLPAFAAALITPFDLLPGAAVAMDAGAEEARRIRAEDLAEAYRLRLAAPAVPGLPELPPPEALHLDDKAWKAALRGRRVAETGPPSADSALPHFAAERDPDAAFLRHARALLGAGARVAIAGGVGQGARRLAARLAGRRAVPVADGWPGLRALPAGSVALLAEAPSAEGFATAEAAVVPLFSVRPAAVPAPDAPRVPALAPAALQPGDAVIHLEQGLGALRGVEPVTAGEATTDCLRLDYAEADSLLVPFDELSHLWRYGATAANVTLDRLDGAAWPKRRAEAERRAREEADRLLALLREREAARAPALRPEAEAMRRVAAGFPHEPTPDQAAAIAATLADLARERPMDRLVCGDVGFGKTEVALRAAAAAALAGRQVAIVAPTTVLVRQHLGTFRRRLAPLGLRVEALSRLTPAGEAKAVRAGIADGSVAVAIGTTALAARGVRFRDLGLLVIDEEQRFGAREKAALARLRGAGALHLLTLTATPIPRTLQSAMIGLRDLSVIATPPVRRQPVRTLRAESEDGLIAAALRREAARGGQTFLVCPRIEDIAPMRARLAAAVPDLTLLVAHGGMKPAEMDDAMLRFAEGEGDVLLATAIVETGLDVPRANTMLVAGADRFGLAQLHQLRGRVGRGRSRGVFWALTEPGRKLAPATERRLRTLSAMDRLGAGFAIAARDLDLRGAGELLGEQQAGHLRAVGVELHAELLGRALAEARGEAPPEQWSPTLALGVDAFIPPDHVPEDALRVELHVRLGRILREGDAAALDALEEEAEDRFGEPPEPLASLFALAWLALRCRALGVARLEVGPQAAAARFRGAPPPALAPPLVLKDGRALLRRAMPDAAARLAGAAALLDTLEEGARAAA